MTKKPRIGITMRLESETNRFYLGRDYSEALENFGALPIHISLIPKEQYIAGILEHLDGVLLPGSNSDIDPLIYGEEPLPRLGTVVPEKDATDLLVLKEAKKLKMPVFGICFGMQSLNVSRGGTLIQDIETEIKDCLKHEQGKPANRNSHGISVKEESFMSGLITKNNIRVNSSHHQAVKNLGADLIATSWARDGVIESIEDMSEKRFVLGVQWHPELNWQSDDLSAKIFQAFVRKCTEYTLARK